MDVDQSSAILNGLSGVPLFQGLDTDSLQKILKSASIRTFENEEFLFYQGDPADRLWVIVEGKVKLTQLAEDGQQILVRAAGPWNLIAVLAMVHNAHYPLSAQAVEPGKILSWRSVEFMQLTRLIPTLAVNAIGVMAGHVQEFQDRYREAVTERVERRLARSLLRLAAQAGKKTEEGVLIDLPLSRQDLAEMSGTTLYTVSRILSRWEERGLVLSGRERVTVRFPHGLVSIAEDLDIK